ncbi:MAG: ADP-ribosylglycohydrolase family protein [Halobacteriaceae archaeon]
MNKNQTQGVLLGLAVGDALGRPIEFKTRSDIERKYGTLTGMVGNGTWGQSPGTITDDTEQALAIARSVVESNDFDPSDIADRFVEWYDTDPFDIGIMTRDSLQKLKEGTPWDKAGREVWQQSREGKNAGNGSVMRTAPLAIAFADDESKLTEVSLKSSRITHADDRCEYGSAILNLTIAAILREEDMPLQQALNYVEAEAPEELLDALTPIAAGDTVEPLSTSGYVVDTLQTALHDGLREESAESAIITAVNRGGDTDTIGAITGAVSGARFGKEGLPDRWLDSIDETPELQYLAAELMTI